MGKAQLIRALQIVAAILVVVLVVGLYKAKSDASKAEAHVRQLHSEIADTEAANRALNAEIAHLESPERVEQLAQEHLALRRGARARRCRNPISIAACQRRAPRARSPVRPIAPAPCSPPSSRLRDARYDRSGAGAQSRALPGDRASCRCSWPCLARH